MDQSSDDPATTSATESSEELAVPKLQTLQNIYRPDLDNFKRDSSVRRSLNRKAYNELQKSSCSSVSHSSVSVLKNRFEAKPETALGADKTVQTAGNESAVKNSPPADKEISISDFDKVAKKEKPTVPKKPGALNTVDEVSKLQKRLKTGIFDGSAIPVRTSPVKRLSSLEIHLQPYSSGNSTAKLADTAEETTSTSHLVKEKTPTTNVELSPKKEATNLELRTKKDDAKPTTPKRVSFSSEVCRIPIPAPRKKLEQVEKTIEVVKVEVKTVEKETVTPVILAPEKSDVNSNYLQTADIDLDSIDFAEPEDKHIIARGSSENLLEKINSDLDSFVMDDKREKKRTNSFRKIWKGGIFKKKETKKAENVDNAQNESFNRSSALRHTVDGHQRNCEYDLERRYAQMHINKFNQAKANFASEDYVCMDNGNRVNKYIDTSSSSNTLDSENCSYEQRSDHSSNHEKPLNTNVVLRNKFFDSGTPPRAQDTYQNVQLVKPKALIPINSERPLPNPYQDKPTMERNMNGQFREKLQGHAEDIYGTVYDKKLVARQPSPDIRSQCSDGSGNQPSRSPSLEGSKLKLPANREKVELQPRIRSPIPQAAVSTDKIIATELLKTRGKKDDRPWSPSHQRLEIEFDYPEQQVDLEPKGKPPVSPQSKIVQNLEAAEWHRKQRVLSQSPAITNSQITTNVVVHVDNRSSTPIQDRSITPVMRNPPLVQRSPPKHEIRQSVEAFCWKELKKLKEEEDRQLQMQISMTPFGYAEEPIIAHRSRSMSPNFQRNTRRSSSLPREVLRQRRLEEPPRRPQNQNFVRGSPQRNTIETSTQRPIFNRGSLTQQFNQMEPQSIYNKKVSFHAAQNRQQVWPTKNGFTQSPPQRRIEIKRSTSENDDVFLPNTPKEPVYNLSREEIFHLNQQKQRQMKEEAERRQGSFNFRPLPNEPGYQNGDYGYSKGVYGGRPMMMPNINENEPMYIDRGYLAKQPEPIYVTRQAPVGNGLRYPQEPLYGRTGPPRRTTVNNKVCDIYGKIHDNPNQRATTQSQGVLYGQLRRNTNAPPLQYQSYDHLRNSNFVRGTRLTASVNDMDRRFQMDPRFEPPNRPLPPLPHDQRTRLAMMRRQPPSDTESNASELQRIYTTSREPPPMKNRSIVDEEWNSDGKSGRGLSGSESGNARNDSDGDLRSRGRNNRRDDPRRHTLAGEQYGVMSGQGGPLSRTMDLEMSSSRLRKGQPRGYQPPSNAMLFDDDPGIMSEVETSSTGFRRGGKQRSSLPVVRTPSKTLERPLGLVFLQYRNETKRALLPNEITSIDTVKALFVRSFPKQLTMEYLDSPQVKIYIHDSSKDMFYELEDLRSHLREIRDRSVLRLFESADVSGGLPMAGIGIAGGVGHFEDPSYFSEPEFDSEYQHQHIHKSKGSAKSAPYYIGSTASLPRAGLLRAYSPAVGNLPQERIKTLPTGAPPKPQRAYSSGTPRSSDGARAPDRFAQFQRPNNSLFNIPDGYMSSPERGSRYEDPYYSQYGTRSGSITPVIDEEISDTELLDEQYSLYGVKIPSAGPRPAPRTQFSTPAAPPYDATRIRVEHMERQLANLTGLVQKALTQTPATLQVPSVRDSYRDDTYVRSETKTPKLGKSGCHKSVSFEKSVSFSDEPPDMNSPKQHSPQHSERDRLKPAPPPKPASLSPGQYDGRHIYRDLQLTPEMYNQLRGLQKKAKDLRAEVRNLRRMSQAQAHSVRETIRDTFIKIRAMLLAGGEQVWQAGMDQERVRLSREEDLYKQEMIRLETDLSDLESTVEELRGNVINRKTRVNMSDVENMALILSKSSKTVADLKLRFPVLQDSMKAMLSTEMEKVVREEKFLKEEPERLESALRRCKKLTGTLVTLKRLASVQEQRLPCSATSADGRLSPTEPPPITPTSAQNSKPSTGPRVGQIGIGGGTSNSADGHQRPENALDALLDELQTFSKPHTVNTQIPQVSYTESEPPTLPVKGIPPSHSSHLNHPPTMQEIGRKGSMDSATILPTQNLTVSTATGSLRRLHSYPSGSDTDNSPPIQPIQRVQVDAKNSGKPPIPERNTELLQHISTKRVPPPPPPRTSSKSPLASPTSPSLPPRSPATNLQHIQNVQNMVENKPMSQFEAATQNLGFGTLRRNIQNRSSLKDRAQTLPRNIGSNLQVAEGENAISASNSSSCESVNSQDGTKKRKEELEQRHQELLKKQKALQEQYARLQQLQRGTNTLAVVPPAPDQLLKKTGSESNILQKMGLQLSTSQITGSLTNLPNTTLKNIVNTTSNASTQPNSTSTGEDTSTSSNSSSTTNKVYETDIL